MGTVIDKIISYENGDLEGDEAIDFFRDLIETGLCWSLQGHYGRTAESLISEGLV